MEREVFGNWGLVDRHTGAWLITDGGMTSPDHHGALNWDSREAAEAALALLMTVFSSDQGHGRLQPAEFPN